jgi:ATP-dependent DNA helicase DinG
LLEVKVHSNLRQMGRADWPHQLTMGRLVARALRLQQSALIQTGIPADWPAAPYRLSYLTPALLWPETVAIVAPPLIRQQIFAALPVLQATLGSNKAVVSDRFSASNALVLLDPLTWLQNHSSTTSPVIIDGADDLDAWIQQWLQVTIDPTDWQEFAEQQSDAREPIIQAWQQLQISLFRRPVNPYSCHLLTPAETALLDFLQSATTLPSAWKDFRSTIDPATGKSAIWAKVDRLRNTFQLCAQKNDLEPTLKKLWQQQPHIVIGNVLDVDRSATNYRETLGFSDITGIKFSLSTAPIRLYVPNWMPMPNTRNFQELFIREALRLLVQRQGFAVIIVGDTPLQTQTAARLAAQYGSLVRFEERGLDNENILVCGWDFWNEHYNDLPIPQLMVIATLPIPSLEDPLVAARVDLCKQQGRDWFRSYLLPVGLRVLLRAIAPVRVHQGLLAILDNRLNHRSYGLQIQAALEPATRIRKLNYLKQI